MKLTDHFSTEEFEKSSTADKHNIDNTIKDPIVQANIHSLCENVLENIRAEFGRTNITSGYRCLELNRKLRSKDTSDHIIGQAADIQLPNVDLKTAFKTICLRFEFDQCIYEDNDHTQWIHISYNHTGTNRNETLIANRVNGKMIYSYA